MVQFTSKLVLATIVAVPALSAPLTEREDLKARGQSMSRMAVKGAGSAFDAYGQNKAKETLNKYTSQPLNVPPGLAEAAKKASPPFSPAAVQAFVAFKQAGKKNKKRDFEDYMYERDFEDNFLEARGQSMSRMAVKGAESAFDAYGQNKAKETLRKYTSQPLNVPPGLAEAAKKASGPFNPAAVQAVVAFKQAGKKNKKRDFEGYMYERDFEDDFLTARGQSMSRMAVKGAESAFEAYGQTKAKDTLKKYTSQPVNVPPGLAEAAKKASGPFNPAAVQAVVAFKQAGKKNKKRDFEDYMYERDFDEDVFERDFDELEEREYYDLEDLD